MLVSPSHTHPLGGGGEEAVGISSEHAESQGKMETEGFGTCLNSTRDLK